MPIKRILVPLLDSSNDRHAILHAADIARALGAHVTVMYSGGYLSELVSEDPPRYGRVKPKLQIEARALLAEQVEAARSAFDSLVLEQSLQVADTPEGETAGTLNFETRRGTLQAMVQEAAVFHDLVFFYRDSGTAEPESALYATIRAALQDCGRPLLIVPKDFEQHFASRVAIGFNGSIEGAHAVSAALSMLKSAQSVHILTIATQKTSVEQARLLQSYLAWHGVRADIHASKQDGDSVGATLLSLVKEVRANLFVLGGYTHSRIRQTILGGVTHHVVQHAPVPVIFSR